jgi:uncharacterized protein YfkK (UPF0435 family)
MLVIKPGHTSQKISVQKALLAWGEENQESLDAIAPNRYNGLLAEVQQISKEVYLESMARCRAAADGWESELEVYRAMGLLVASGLKGLHGLEDVDGNAVNLTSIDGVLDKDSLDVLHDNDLMLDMWRIVRHYNELTASEKKAFSERVQPTSHS